MTWACTATAEPVFSPPLQMEIIQYINQHKVIVRMEMGTQCRIYCSGQDPANTQPVFRYYDVIALILGNSITQKGRRKISPLCVWGNYFKIQ